MLSLRLRDGVERKSSRTPRRKLSRQSANAHKLCAILCRRRHLGLKSCGGRRRHRRQRAWWYIKSPLCSGVMVKHRQPPRRYRENTRALASSACRHRRLRAQNVARAAVCNRSGIGLPYSYEYALIHRGRNKQRASARKRAPRMRAKMLRRKYRVSPSIHLAAQCASAPSNVRFFTRSRREAGERRDVRRREYQAREAASSILSSGISSSKRVSGAHERRRRV